MSKFSTRLKNISNFSNILFSMFPYLYFLMLLCSTLFSIYTTEVFEKTVYF